MFRPAAVPYLLVALRFVCGLAMVGVAVAKIAYGGPLCAALLAIGVVSDIYDGVIARRLGSDTDLLRLLDSRCDLVFWTAATGAAVLLHPALLARTWPIILVFAVLEASVHIVSFARFRREASPHHLLSKLFALSLWVLLTLLLITGDGGWLQAFVFALGVASELEALAITLALPSWRRDVRNLGEALALRRAARAPA
jgi:CDP-diacylglycerol--glycerol-3-phosphate 3-phosphatidyltransferase